MTAPAGRRRAGLLVPLFSCVSSRSWGIGEIGDLAPMTFWLAGAGQRLLQLLPINEMAPGGASPYSAISAMAIDPVFVRVQAVRDFRAIGGEASLGAADRDRLDRVRRSPVILHRDVRQLKMQALDRSFARFVDAEWVPRTARGRALRRFIAGQAWWLEDYALFRALHAQGGERSWLEWPEALQRRDPTALGVARQELSREILFREYLQWIAAEQWKSARTRALANGVELLGDLPFMVDADSADVWRRQQQFRFDASVGTPPDAFSASGQDWGVPVYRWNVLVGDDFRWLRERARRAADLFEGYRVDHLVGFYRTFSRPRDGSTPSFTPPSEAAQTQLGETVLGIFREPGSEIIAEDLGTVPDFVRASLVRLGVPGYRVLRWERHWHEDEQPFRDPAEYPAASVATSGTHDTEPLATWWDSAPAEDRRKLSLAPTIRRIAGEAEVADLVTEPYDPRVRDVLLEALYASGSNLLVLPVQDVFGWRDRINDPAEIDGANWVFRLPWPCDGWNRVPQARERRSQLRTWAEKHGRL
jgi:4-alpha-glucanotransferase